MVRQGVTALGLAALACGAGSCGGAGREPVVTSADPGPPPAPRELRAAWVATVANIDWPSKKGLSAAEQQREIVAIVERAHELRLNALMLQVRPSADTIHPSSLEPWSEFLTGEQGRAPEPIYDPLATWVDEAHRRGIELHAWFNPYRARHHMAVSPDAPSHVAKRRPELVRRYGGYEWLDPGEPDSAEVTMAALLDVVRRYDVDGVHLDDYFYPYPEAASDKTELAFPDDASFERYQSKGGELARADWRRKNVTDLIERISREVHAEKRWVKVSVSPFGLGRPDRRPSGVEGFSQYDKLYADVETWLERGYIDWLVPQLYWPAETPRRPFGKVLGSWMASNPQGRSVFPGLFTSRVADGSQSPWDKGEILREIRLSRELLGQGHLGAGHVHFSMRALLEDRDGLATALKRDLYTTEALVPASPWLDSASPPKPIVIVEGKSLRLIPPTNKTTTRFVVFVRSRRDRVWHFETLAAEPRRLELTADDDRARISVIDRVGNESEGVVLAL